MGGFNTTYSAGGVIDEVKKVNLPKSLFPEGDAFKSKGFRLEIPPLPTAITHTYTLPHDIDLIDITFAASGYHDDDYWEFDIGDRKVCETMYTKELPENISQGNAAKISFEVKANTEMVFSFYNQSATSKKVWFTLRYLYMKEES